MGLFVQKATLVFSYLRSWAAEPLARMSPAALLRRMVPGGILRNRANPGSGPLYGALTFGISIAGGWMAGFGVVFGLSLVSFSWGVKNRERNL